MTYFNRITFIPKELGDLFQLRDFNCACNEIDALPKSIGKLVKLRTVKANGNKLTAVPDTIGGCKSLQTLHLSENKIVVVPSTLADCSILRVVRLQNNSLQTLPHELGILKGFITEIDVSNNPKLDMIPKEMRGNTTIVMWILGLQLQNHLKVVQVDDSNREMFALINDSKEGTDVLNDDIKAEKLKKRELLIERSGVETYLKARQAMSIVRCTIS